MKNLSEEELIKAALGDLDGVTPPPQPPTPPNPLTPKKKKSKAVPIIAAVILVIAVFIAVSAFTNGQSSGPDYYYDGDGYDEEYVNSQEDETDSSSSALNPFDAFEYAVYTENGDCFAQLDPDYGITYKDYEIKYGTYDGETVLTIHNMNGELVGIIDFYCDCDAYNSSGTVDVRAGVSVEMKKTINLSEELRSVTPLTGECVQNADDISSSDYEILKSRALEEITKEFPLGEIERVYFKSYYDEGSHNCLRFVYSYNDNYGNECHRSIIFDDMILVSNGRIFEPSGIDFKDNDDEGITVFSWDNYSEYERIE